jgi:toxoflavin biosynthesis protein ToxC
VIKHIGPISGVATYGDHLVATAGYDNRLILWDGERRPLAAGVHDHLANQCSFSPDGKFLASASSDYTARLWAVPSLRLKAVFDCHSDDVEMVSFDPTGNFVATCSRDRTLAIFDLGGRLLSRLRGHADDVISVGWDAGSGHVVSSSDDGTIKRWNPLTGGLVESIDLQGVQTDTLAITELGTIFAGNDDGEIIRINPQTTRVKAHSAGVKRLIYSQTAKLLASMSYDRSVIFWKVKTDQSLQELRRTVLPPIVWPRSGAFLGTSRLVLGTFGSTYAYFDISDGSWTLGDIENSIALNAVARGRDGIYSVGDAGVVHLSGSPISSAHSLCNFLLPFGDLILTGGQMGCVFDARTGRTLYQHRSPLNCGAVFTKDGVLHAIIGSYTGEGLIFRETPQGAEFVTAITLHHNAVKGVACSKQEVFSVCATGAAALHSLEDFRLLREIPAAHTRIANGCVHVRDDVFASIGRDLKLRIWKDGKQEVVSTPHKNSIKCLACSPCGRWIATGSYAGLIAVYDRSIEQWCHVSRPTAAGISSLCEGGESGAFLASSYDGHVYRISATPSALQQVA